MPDTLKGWFGPKPTASLTLAFAAFAGGGLMLNPPAMADEWEEDTLYYEDDAWYDISEWFDGNDFNPTDESIGVWDDETYDIESETGDDYDNDYGYGYLYHYGGDGYGFNYDYEYGYDGNWNYDDYEYDNPYPLDDESYGYDYWTELEDDRGYKLLF